MRLHVVEERHVEKKAVPDGADSAVRERRRPGPEDRERVVVVPAAGEPRIAPARHDEVPGEDAVLADLGIAVEARPELVVGTEAVERGGAREELRRGREDERPLGVERDEGRRVAEPRDDDAHLGTPDRAPPEQRVEALLERRGPRGFFAASA